MRCGRIVDGAGTVGPINVFTSAITRYRHVELVFMPCRAAPFDHLLDLRADDVPNLVPHFARGSPQRAGMALGAYRAAIGVIVKAGEILAPPDVHRMPRIEHQPDREAQRLRPRLGLAKRGSGPLVRPHKRTHFPAAGEKRRCLHGEPVYLSLSELEDRRPRLTLPACRANSAHLLRRQKIEEQ